MSRTFGIELELADIDTTISLPTGLLWDYNDYTIVSTTGIANDPKKTSYKRGSEIITIPGSLDEILDIVYNLFSLNTKMSVNYSTNLHVHVRVPELLSDIVLLQNVFEFIQLHQQEAFDFTESIPPVQFAKTKFSKKLEAKRVARRKVSHQHTLRPVIVDQIRQATTLQQFLDYHAPIDKHGKRSWGVVTRPGINMLQLKETETIEFRHFSQSLDIYEIESALRWVDGFIDLALQSADSLAPLYEQEWLFPKFQDFDFALNVGYLWTTHAKNSRKVVDGRLASMKKAGFDLYEPMSVNLLQFIIDSSDGKYEF